MSLLFLTCLSIYAALLGKKDILKKSIQLGRDIWDGIVKSYARDITELQLKYETLRRSENVYRTLLENASDCVCHIDLDGKFIYMNQGGVEINELKSAEEVQGLDCAGSIKPQYPEQMYVALDKARQGERTKIEYISINAKGRELWWRTDITEYFGVKPKIRFVFNNTCLSSFFRSLIGSSI